MAFLIWYQLSKFIGANLFVHIRRIALRYVCVVIFLLVIVVCNVPRDVRVSMIQLGRLMLFNVQGVVIRTFHHLFQWMQLRFSWTGTILQVKNT